MKTYKPVTSSSFRISARLARRLTVFGLAALLWLGSSGYVAASPSGRLDRSAFLNAIAEVETGGNARAVGRYGERGLFQFRSSVWRQYTTRSFYQAHNPTVAFEVATKHFDWLYAGFVRNGREPDAYLMAAAWNGGLSRVLSGRLPRATRSYAMRVANIVSVTGTHTAAVEPAPSIVFRGGNS